MLYFDHKIYSLVDPGDVPKTPHPLSFDNNPIAEYIDTKRHFYHPNNTKKWKPFDYRFNYTQIPKKKYQPRPTKKQQKKQQQKINKINKTNNNNNLNTEQVERAARNATRRKPVGFYDEDKDESDHSQDLNPIQRYQKYYVKMKYFIYFEI